MLSSPRWDDIWGEELYDHTGDNGSDLDAWENVNLAADTHRAHYTTVIAELQTVLKNHFNSDH